MSQVAEVIVDVPTMQTNTPYSYLIPAALTTPLLPGMRVIVPFGNGSRKVQGFVWQVHEQVPTTHELKTIDSVMDLSPVLNKELLAMADWLAKTTFAFTITVLLTMLPNALKAAYERWATPNSDLDPPQRNDFLASRKN